MTHRSRSRWPQYVRFSIGLFVGAMMCVFSSNAARAQAPNPQAEADNLFRNLDANGDGQLTVSEARPDNRNMLEQIFQMAGKQPGGSVSRAEFQQVFNRVRGGGAPGSQPPGQPPRPQPPANPQPPAPNAAPTGDAELPPFLKRADTNGDGKLNRTEWGRVSQMFNQLDTNKDGMLDAAELQAAGPTTNPPPTRPTSTSSTGAGSGGSINSIWRGWVVDGRGENPNSGQMEVELTITGNTIRARELGTQRVPQGLGAGTFVMTGDARSGNLDATQTEGQNQGRNYQGIYQIDGDVLRWCVSNRPGQRPTEFATQGAGTYLLILRRAGG